jgi:hypothetical protein
MGRDAYRILLRFNILRVQKMQEQTYLVERLNYRIIRNH